MNLWLLFLLPVCQRVKWRRLKDTSTVLRYNTEVLLFLTIRIRQLCNFIPMLHIFHNSKKLIVVTLAELSHAPQRKESNSSITRVCQDGFMILTAEPLLRYCLHCMLMKMYSTDWLGWITAWYGYMLPWIPVCHLCPKPSRSLSANCKTQNVREKCCDTTSAATRETGLSSVA